jgi:soluble lytic murein transglycosylase-like protein
MSRTVIATPGVSSASKEALAQLIALADELGVDADYLATVISFESGWDPAMKNRAGSGATGLIQFMPETAVGLGTTTAKLAQMTDAQQMPYVRKHFLANLGKGGSRTLADVYMAVLYPKAVGKPEDFVLYAAPSAKYVQNSGLDRGNKGYVTKADGAQAVRDVYYGAQSRVDVENAPPAPPPVVIPEPASTSDGTPTAVLFALGLAIGVGAYWMITTSKPARVAYR